VKRTEHTLVIGAGLAGLACAYRLKSDYAIFERERFFGGLCTTREENGFRFDRTGHLLHLRQGKVRQTVLNLLDEEPLTIAREARIFSMGVYTHYPFQANLFGLDKAVVTECLTAFIDAYKKKDDNASAPSTFEEFIYRHFGEGIANRFMIPYNAKLWGVHPRDITADWCKRFVPTPNVEEVVKGAVGLHQNRMGYNASFFYPRRGIEALPRAFERRVKPIQYGRRLNALDWKAGRALIGSEWVPYQALVTTIPLNALAAALVSPPPEIAEAASTLRCTSLRYLDVALKRKAGTPYHWVYVPERRYPFYRVGCYSNFSFDLAPKNKSHLYVELTSRQPVHLDTLLPKVADGLKDMGIIRSLSDIEFVRPRRIAEGYVIYNKDYSRSVGRILPWLEENLIFSAGRYARWEYAAMEDAVEQGFSTADKIRNRH
jgi:protoporphyrinogen oxidase